MPENTFGKRTIMVRGTRNMSQTELAKRSGATPSRINRLEAGHNEPSLRTAIKIADALDVSLDFLSGRSEGSPEMAHKMRILAQIEALKAQL